MQQEPVTIIPVRSEDVLPIRHQVMWPDKPLSFVKIEGDENALHLALLVGTTIVSVVSVFDDENGWQFRKLATLPGFRCKGYGTLLIKEVLQRASAAGVSRLWCNARKEKSLFYSTFGLQPTGETFSREGKEYLIMGTQPPSNQSPEISISK